MLAMHPFTTWNEQITAAAIPGSIIFQKLAYPMDSFCSTLKGVDCGSYKEKKDGIKIQI